MDATDTTTYTCQMCGETVEILDQPTHVTANHLPQLYRVTYTTSGLRRRSKTIDHATMTYLRDYGWINGMRLTSYRKATDAEAARGPFTGSLNS